jgi:hypothetical protein
VPSGLHRHVHVVSEQGELMSRRTGRPDIDWTPERESALLQHRNSGKTFRQVAAVMGLEYEAVRGRARIMKAHGAEFVVARHVFWTPERLRQAHILRTQKKSSREIGRILGCPPATVRKWWSRINPTTKPERTYVPELIALYEARELTLEQIARRLNLGRGKVSREAKRLIAAGKLLPRKPVIKGSLKEPPPIRLGDDVRFAMAMNGRRYEDAPHTPGPFVSIPRHIAPITYTGGSAAMCVELGTDGVADFFERKREKLRRSGKHKSTGHQVTHIPRPLQAMRSA